MSKLKPTIADHIKKACTPRYWNPAFYILHIFMLLVFIVINLLESFRLSYTTFCDQMKECGNKVYHWRTSEWLTKKEYFEQIGEDIKRQDEMDAVQGGLKYAQHYGMEIEVVAWALKAMKEDPTLTLGEAISHGLEEWVD